MSSDDSLAQGLIELGMEKGEQIVAQMEEARLRRGVLAMYKDGLSMELMVKYTGKPESKIKEWIDSYTGEEASEPQIEMTEDEKLDLVAARILREHKAAFEELAKW